MQPGEWLDFVINVIAIIFQIPEREAENLKNLLGSPIRDHLSSYRELARIAVL